MTKQLALIPDLPRRPRTWRMHVADAGTEAVRFACRRCAYDSGWLRYDETDSVTKLKRGLPCPRCNGGVDGHTRNT